MASVDEHGELHGVRPPVVGEGVEGGAHRPSGEQHVVDEHDGGSIDADGQLVAACRGDRSHADVVAVERHVDLPDRHGVLEPFDLGGESVGNPRAPTLQADEHDTIEPMVALGDLVGDAGDRPAHVVGAEHLLTRGHGVVHQSFRTGLTGPA